jgi:hypothetical protein
MGREIEFEYDGEEYFMSCDKAKKYVSLWKKQAEQSFESVEELIENALVGAVKFLSAWEEAKIKYIY